MYPGNLPLVASYVANFVKLNPGWLAVTARPGNGGRVTIAEAPIMIDQVPYHKADSPGERCLPNLPRATHFTVGRTAT